MKRIYKEIIWIIILSSSFGIVYNLISDKSIPFFPVIAKVKAVSDSTLFGGDKIQDKYFDKIVSYEQIVKLVDKNDVQFIDARSPEQYAAGHIGNSINIFPLMDEQDQLFIKVNELPHDKILIVYCDGGECDLSHDLLKILFEFGYKQAFLYKGGWEEWGLRKKKIEKRRTEGQKDGKTEK